MYPFIRLGLHLWGARKLPQMGLTDTHFSQHTCFPWDCDMFGEMNNGRILTLYELGRFEAAVRMGLWAALKREKWGLAVAGTSIRYRKRITPLEKYEMRSRVLCWDDRFVYIEQGMFKRSGDCASHILIRTAVVEKGRSVPSERVLKALGRADPSPEPPQWAANWIAAEATRPWPPMEDGPQDAT